MEKRGNITRDTPNTEDRQKTVVEVDLQKLAGDIHSRCADKVKTEYLKNTENK